MRIKIYILFSIIISLIITSCNNLYHQDPIPSYIHIDNINVTTTLGQGSTSSKITDAWTYIDGQLLGCFQMPCTFPALWSGVHTITIRPGIKVNGISVNRVPYPFYTTYTHSFNLTTGTTTNLTGVTVSYFPTPQAQFLFIEDFESVGNIFDTTHNCNIPLALSNLPSSDVFEGQHSAVGALHSGQSLFECGTISPYSLNGSGAPVFLELNYKCNQPFTVYVVGYSYFGTIISNTSSYTEAITINISPSWNKIYVYLTPAISQISVQIANPAKFNIYFDMNNTNNADSVGFAADNIKLIQ